MQDRLPPIHRVWLLIGLGVAVITPLEMYASGWWHIAAVILIFIAITAAVGQFRRDALDRLAEARERHRDLLNALPHYIFSLDGDDRYIALNAHACSYFGLPEQEIVGRTAEELGIFPEVACEWHEINARTRQTGTTQMCDLVISGAEPRYEHVITQPLRNHRGEIVGVTGISIDVTDSKHAEESQRRLDEQIAHFSKMESLATLAGGIAHDFNNILSGILAHATILERRSPEAAQQRSIDSIKQSVERGAAISRQILTFARRTEIDGGTVDVARLVSDLYTLVAETFPRTVRVQVARDSDLPPIAGDVGQLQQALLNLCINARDAMPEGGVLTMETRRAGDRVMIAISDSGVGIDDETRRRMFEPFFSTKAKPEGTGLGLAMVYGIVRSHSGEIEVDSSPGCGTTFRIYFPIVPYATIAEETQETPATPRGERVLIIDDEPEILAGLEMQLAEEGYVVETASNGADALEHIREPPDIVLMDLGMPRMGAAELIDKLRAYSPSLRIVAMTGYVDPEVHAAVRQAGVTRILQKPFGGLDLLAAVSEALRE